MPLTPDKKTRKTKKLDQRQQWLVALIRARAQKKKEFAQDVNIPYTALVDMTTGTRAVSDPTVYKIIAVMGCPPPPGMTPPAMHLVSRERDLALSTQQALLDRIARLEATVARMERSSQSRRNRIEAPSVTRANKRK